MAHPTNQRRKWLIPAEPSKEQPITPATSSRTEALNAQWLACPNAKLQQTKPRWSFDQAASAEKKASEGTKSREKKASEGTKSREKKGENKEIITKNTAWIHSGFTHMSVFSWALLVFF